MPRPADVDYLQEDETVLHQAGRHPLSVLDDVLGATLLAGLLVAGLLVWTLGYQPRFLVPVAVPAISVVVACWVLFLIMRWLRVTTSLYTITDQRVYKSYGRLRFFLSQTTYDKLTDLHVRQSFFGRIKGFGTVRLETAGTGIALEGLPDPFGSKQQVERARSAFLRLLVGTARQTKAPAATEAEPAPMDETEVWTEGPKPVAFLGNFIALGVMAIAASAGFLALPLLGMQALLLPGVLAIAVASTALSIWVRVRHTRYHLNPSGVVVTSGWLARRRVETTFAKVTDVTVYQGLLGRVFDHGSITINTAGSTAAPVVFAGVGSPQRVKHLIDETRRRWEARQ